MTPPGCGDRFWKSCATESGRNRRPGTSAEEMPRRSARHANSRNDVSILRQIARAFGSSAPSRRACSLVRAWLAAACLRWIPFKIHAQIVLPPSEKEKHGSTIFPAEAVGRIGGDNQLA